RDRGCASTRAAGWVRRATGSCGWPGCACAPGATRTRKRALPARGQARRLVWSSRSGTWRCRISFPLESVGRATLTGWRHVPSATSVARDRRRRTRPPAPGTPRRPEAARDTAGGSAAQVDLVVGEEGAHVALPL